MDTLLVKQITLFGIIGFCTATTEKPTKEYRNWMAQIPSARWLSEISIPGTHSSLALHGGLQHICQKWSLEDQLNGGVRYIEISLVDNMGRLDVSYGGFNMQETFVQVLMTIRKFLKRQPTETVLLKVNEDDSKSVCVKLFTDLSVHLGWDMLYHPYWNPTLTDVRGKVVIVHNITGPSFGIAYDTLKVADNVEVSNAFHLDWVKKRIEEHITKAINGPKADFYITYTTGTGWSVNPSMVTYTVNNWMKTYLSGMTDVNKRLGIIVMDFISTDHIKDIIACQLK